MRKKLLGLFVILICYGATIGFTSIKPEEESVDGIEYEYDELNRVIKETYPDGRTILYQYDKNGNLLKTTVLIPGEADAVNTETKKVMIVNGEMPGIEASGHENSITENQEALSGNADRSIDGHGLKPGVTTLWNAGWIIIIFLIAVLTGGAIWKIRKSRIQESGKTPEKLQKRNEHTGEEHEGTERNL